MIVLQDNLFLSSASFHLSLTSFWNLHHLLQFSETLAFWKTKKVYLLTISWIFLCRLSFVLSFFFCDCNYFFFFLRSGIMAQLLLHGTLHVCVYEVDKIKTDGLHDFFHKVIWSFPEMLNYIQFPCKIAYSICSWSDVLIWLS